MSKWVRFRKSSNWNWKCSEWGWRELTKHIRFFLWFCELETFCFRVGGERNSRICTWKVEATSMSHALNKKGIWAIQTNYVQPEYCEISSVPAIFMQYWAKECDCYVEDLWNYAKVVEKTSDIQKSCETEQIHLRRFSKSVKVCQSRSKSVKISQNLLKSVEIF